MPDTPRPAPEKTAGDPGSAVGLSGTPEVGPKPDNNLPLRLSGLVGRGREIEEVARLLADRRLLTLTGPGGSGKTRLALAVAHEVAQEYEDGAWFVELAPLSEPELVAQAVASVLGVREAPGGPLTETLAAHLRPRHLLLVLDNCEHLVEASGSLAVALVRSCPKLSVLATSREALTVEGEALFVVPPLSLPDPGRTPDVEGLAEYEAARLFAERARAVRPAFEITEANAMAVAQVCHRLDGMPLAIELAAARARVLSAGQIASRLDDRFALLKGGPRTAMAHHETLLATMDWSYDLLSEEEKVLFGRLSVFAGGFALEAAEEVCADGGFEELLARDDVLDLLTRLVDKSLVHVAEQDGQARFDLLETVRQYASERLEEGGEAEEVRCRHAGCFLALAEELEPAMWGAKEATLMDRLWAERDNLRAALSWSMEWDAELALRLAAALRWFWYRRGHYGEGRRWLDGALAKGGRAPAAAQAGALHAAGWLAHDQADMDRVEAVAEEGVQLGKTAEIEASLAASFRNLLGEAARHRGDYERANRLLEEGTELYRRAGDRRGVSWGVFLQGNAASLRGDHERAAVLYGDGLILSRELGGAQPLGDYLTHLGHELLLRGDHERAAALSEEAAALLRNRGYRGGLQFALDNLGWVALARGDLEGAVALYGESLALCRELGDRLVASDSLEGLGCVARVKGGNERAAKLFGAAQGMLGAVGYRQTPRGRALSEPHLAAVRARLGAARWQAAIAEGEAMTLDEAAEYARGAGQASARAAEDATAMTPSLLSEREGEVLLLVAQGLTNPQVAERLYLSPRTVGQHLRSIYRKLGVSTRAAATREASERGLL